MLLLVLASLQATQGAIDFRTAPVVMEGHEAAVTMVQYAPGGRKIFSASGSELLVWDGERKARTVAVEGPAAVSWDGEQIAAANIDNLSLMANGGASISKVIEGTDYFGLPSGDIICQLSFSHDGKRIAVAGFQSKAAVVTLASDVKKQITMVGGPAECMSLSPDGTLLAIGHEKGVMGVYNSDTSAAVRAISGFTRTVSCIAFSPDGKMLGAGSEDGGIKVWKTSDWSEVRSFTCKGLVFALAFTPDSSALAYTFNVAEQKSAIEIAALADGKNIARVEKLNFWVFALAFSPDGLRLAAGCEDGAVRAWAVK